MRAHFFLLLPALLMPAVATPDQKPIRPVYCVEPIVFPADFPEVSSQYEIRARASNEKGDTVFSAFWRDPDGRERSGLFLSSGGSTTTIAMAGTRVPGERLLLFRELHSFATASINDTAEIAFKGGVSIQESFPPRESSGVFVFRMGSIRTLAIGDHFTGLAINNKGGVLFADAQGIHLWRDTSRSTIVSAGQSVPGLGGASFDYFGDIFSNSSGLVGFVASIDGPRPGGGLFLYSGSELSAVLLPGQVLGDYRLDGFEFRGVDEAGGLVFSGCQITGLAPPFKAPPSIRFGLFRYSEGSITPVVLLGQEVPGLDGPVGTIGPFSVTGWGAISCSLRSVSGAWTNFFIFNGTFTPVSYYLTGNPPANAAQLLEPQDPPFFTAPLLLNGVIPTSSYWCRDQIFVARPILAAGLPTEDFEDPGPNQLPARWQTVWNNTGTGGAWQYDSNGEDSFSGSSVLRLYVAPRGGSTFVLSNAIPVAPNTVYTLTARMRYYFTSLSNAAILTVLQYDGDGNEIAINELYGTAGDNFWAWKPKALCIRTGSETAAVRIRIGLVASRESYLDVDAVGR